MKKNSKADTGKGGRPDWDRYYMDIAHVVATRGNCLRRKVAAVILRDQRIISTGYNGTPRGVKNCIDGGCPRCAGRQPSGAGLHDCICAHAEENAITQAAYHGISLRGGVMYCTLSPCLICARMIVNAGIAEVVFEKEYEYHEAIRKLFRQARVKCRKLGKA
jgi:dCMP deaminase